MITFAKEKRHMVVIATPAGDEVGVIYRDPTTAEVHKYNQEAVQRKGNKVKFRHSEAQLKYGRVILKGVRDGDCAMQELSGEIRPISSDPQSPDYREDWADLLEQYAPTIIIALGAHVFGGTEALDGEEDAEDVGKN